MSCFCKKRDLLSQWRGYGATGGGYALGFSTQPMRVPEPSAGTPILRRVIYAPKTQTEIVRSWVRALLTVSQELAQSVRVPSEGNSAETSASTASESFPTPAASNPPSISAGKLLQSKGLFGLVGWMGVIVAAAMSNQVHVMDHAMSRKRLLEQAQREFQRFLAECVICFKDPAYAEEQEWRFIQFGRHVSEIKFRPSGPRIVPYIELDLSLGEMGSKKLPLTSITYGPTLEPDVTQRSLEMLLKHHTYARPDVEIHRSGVPYRS
jgi:hypothetical protein